MASVLVMKNAEGKLEGFGERGARAYNRFLADVRKLEMGELLAFSYKAPRSGPFHRRHFKMLDVFFQSQEYFSDEYAFRKWGEMGAGHCAWVPGPDGQMQAVPKSIDYESLDDIEFRPIHMAVKDFLRSERARSTLWPHLTDHATWETVDMLLMEFER